MVSQFMAVLQKKLKPIFLLQKKILRQYYLKARYYPTADFFDDINVSNVYDYYTVELLFFVLKSDVSVLPTENLNPLYERKKSKDKTRKTQINLFS